MDAFARPADRRQISRHASRAARSASWSPTGPTARWSTRYKAAAEGAKARAVKIVAPKIGGVDPQGRQEALEGRRPAGRHALGGVRRRRPGPVRSRLRRADLKDSAAAIDFVAQRLRPPQGDRLHRGVTAAARQGGCRCRRRRYRSEGRAQALHPASQDPAVGARALGQNPGLGARSGAGGSVRSSRAVTARTRSAPDT